MKTNIEVDLTDIAIRTCTQRLEEKLKRQTKIINKLKSNKAKNDFLIGDYKLKIKRMEDKLGSIGHAIIHLAKIREIFGDDKLQQLVHILECLIAVLQTLIPPTRK